VWDGWFLNEVFGVRDAGIIGKKKLRKVASRDQKCARRKVKAQGLNEEALLVQKGFPQRRNYLEAAFPRSF